MNILENLYDKLIILKMFSNFEFYTFEFEFFDSLEFESFEFKNIGFHSQNI